MNPEDMSQTMISELTSTMLWLFLRTKTKTKPKTLLPRPLQLPRPLLYLDPPLQMNRTLSLFRWHLVYLCPKVS